MTTFEGTDADVSSIRLFRIDGHWYGPVLLDKPTATDEQNDKAMAAALSAIEKAKALGLTDKDIKAMRF